LTTPVVPSDTDGSSGGVSGSATPVPEAGAEPSLVTTMVLGVLVVAGIAGGFVYWRQKYGAARGKQQDGD
jgi:uncharacterized membrane protein